jgi:hypothetical protein
MPKKVEKEVEEVEETVGYDFNVAEPQIVKPQDLPLVVTPPASGWANSAQEEFARTINGYAYKNPKKWAVKKDKMLSQLSELATNPELINQLRGAEDENTRLTYSNKLMES